MRIISFYDVYEIVLNLVEIIFTQKTLIAHMNNVRLNNARHCSTTVFTQVLKKLNNNEGQQSASYVKCRFVSFSNETMNNAFSKID